MPQPKGVFFHASHLTNRCIRGNSFPLAHALGGSCCFKAKGRRMEGHFRHVSDMPWIRQPINLSVAGTMVTAIDDYASAFGEHLNSLRSSALAKSVCNAFPVSQRFERVSRIYLNQRCRAKMNAKVWSHVHARRTSPLCAKTDFKTPCHQDLRSRCIRGFYNIFYKLVWTRKWRFGRAIGYFEHWMSDHRSDRRSVHEKP